MRLIGQGRELKNDVQKLKTEFNETYAHVHTMKDKFNSVKYSDKFKNNHI